MPPHATCGAARSWASTVGCRRTGTAGTSAWRGSRRRRETWTARSSCSMRRSDSMSGARIPARRCGPSRGHATAHGPASAYARRLLSAFETPARLAPTPLPAGAAALVEPLTRREVEILRLIAAGMRNQEIAEQLFISLSTVKRHLANAYGKLGASHRTEAVARANALDLL